MNTRVLYIFRASLTPILLVSSVIGFNGCSDSKVSAAGSSEYANPDSIPFSKDHLVLMLNQTYTNFYHTAPASGIAAIENAKDDKEARLEYNKAIDSLVNDGQMQQRWKDYAYAALGVGSSAGFNEELRFPANLWGKVLLSGDKISEFLLADYAVTDTGTLGDAAYPGGPPPELRAGYFTTRVWSQTYVNQFKFKAIREAVNFNLCDTAPYTKVNLYEWTEDEINTKYTESGGIRCYSCHKNMNPLRFAWRNFDGNGNYAGNVNQNNNQYGNEANDGSQATLEPRMPATGAPLAAATAETTKYKLTENGVIVSSPRILAQEIAKNDRYPRCMVERFLSVFLNAEQGHPGQNYIVPNNFSGSKAQVAFLDKWTTTFNEGGQIPKDFFKAFLKSSDYLIVGYTQDE